MNKLFRFILSPIGVIYRIVVKIRNICYDLKILPSFRLKCKVVSVGNITIGGTGKTPAVIALAKYFQDKHISPAILSRGYRKKTKGTVLVTDGKTICSDWQSVGDEAFFTAHSLKSIPIVVDPNRIRGGQYLIERFNPDVIILDDAFQHRRIRRDLDLVLLNCLDGREKYRLIPFGNLREPLSQLRRADLIVLSKSNLGSFPSPSVNIDKRSKANIYKGSLSPTGFLLDKNGKNVSIQEVQDKVGVLVSGVGNPSGFLKTVESLKLKISTHLSFRDHQIYTKKMIENIISKVKVSGSDFILTTEKDMFKLTSFLNKTSDVSFPCEVYSLPVCFIFTKDALGEIYRSVF